MRHCISFESGLIPSMKAVGIRNGSRKYLIWKREILGLKRREENVSVSSED